MDIFQWNAEDSMPDGYVVNCPDHVLSDDGCSQVCTPNPLVCASAVPDEELAQGEATPRESQQLRMEAVLDKLRTISAPKWCDDVSGDPRSTGLVPTWCSNYSDACGGILRANVNSFGTQSQGVDGVNAQVVCNRFETPATPKHLLSTASWSRITGSTTRMELSLADALNASDAQKKEEEGNRQAFPHEQPELGQGRACLRQVDPTVSDLPQQEAASVGSIGHPHFCAQACKYVNRKSGCRDGNQCPNCHLCRWQRTKVAQQPHVTVNKHPETEANQVTLERAPLREPMKIDLFQRDDFYLKEAPRSSSEAHLKPWMHDEEESVIKLQQKPPVQECSTMPGCSPSVGSLNHPHGCGAPCKYAGKRRGCKDGNSCTRCHLCKWNRYVPHLPLVQCTRITHLQL